MFMDGNIKTLMPLDLNMLTGHQNGISLQSNDRLTDPGCTAGTDALTQIAALNRKPTQHLRKTDPKDIPTLQVGHFRDPVQTRRQGCGCIDKQRQTHAADGQRLDYSCHQAEANDHNHPCQLESGQSTPPHSIQKLKIVQPVSNPVHLEDMSGMKRIRIQFAPECIGMTVNGPRLQIMRDPENPDIEFRP